MLFGELITVYLVNHMKHINAPCGKYLIFLKRVICVVNNVLYNLRKRGDGVTI
jgi:hypothetical protein